jgi:murein DD-endopeptidase MepM/ murein hydrolase activator NlpD
MGFAAAMAVATSVPAASLPSANPLPQNHGTSTSASAGPRQSVTTGDTVVNGMTPHDDFSVTTRDQLVDLSHIKVGDTFTNDPNSPVQWPFPVGVPIASYFGPRIAPTPGASTFHEGIDFDPGLGVDVHSIAKGVVQTVHTAAGGGFGVYVVIDHVIDGKKVASLYGHMRPGSLTVHEGQHVDVAQVIGKVGDTGISTGPHMHFEILENDTTPVDPYAWLKAHVV